MLESVEPTATLLLRRAKEAESRYDWLGAAEYYGNAIRQSLEYSSGRGGICEHLAYALFRAAFQSDEPAKFREIVERAIVCYRQAEKSYSETSKPGDLFGILRCRAMALYLEHWLG